MRLDLTRCLQSRTYIVTLELDRIHDATLERFIADRRAQSVAARTINRSLEIVRTVLNRAPRQTKCTS